ncbi:MAG: hypothetical protein K2N06_00595 [Oscillospiraceae bacterium]|nr:hypothetical protein [Oscillospiraceae bacterium]
MKKFLVVPICVLVLVGAFAVSIYAAEVGNKSDSKLAADVSNKVSDVNNQTAVSIDYGEVSINPCWEGLPYQEGIITGEIDPNAPKLDLAAAREIIAKHNDFDEILSEFDKVQKYPDFIGGSGHIVVQYWLNDSRSEEITVFPLEHGIWYGILNSDGTTTYTEELF